MILENDGRFVLQTANTTYAFEVMPTGHLQHLYYGKKLRFRENPEEFSALRQKREFPIGNAISYEQDNLALTMEDTLLEVSGPGKGDLRASMAEVVFADGARSLDFIYKTHEISNLIPKRATLPGSYAEDGNHEAKVLRITLSERAGIVEKNYRLRLVLTYIVYEAEDIITRYADLYNDGDEEVEVRRLLSMQLDLPDKGYEGIFFDGAWAREMHSYHVSLGHGMHVSRSNCGASSNRANPFFMVARPNCDEDRGECFGFNLIYSGNHMEVCDSNTYGKIRILSGINDEGFSYTVKPGEFLEAPEAVMTYTQDGFNALSHNMHAFVREHIIRGEWKGKDKPILLNSWEASYFKFDEGKLLKLAKRAADAGIELFVMDDGWFGERNDDTKSLGDWEVNKSKLPGGLKRLSDKIHGMGLSFGIWVEPEMVNVNSNLYKAHPDWCLVNPRRGHSEGRNQRVLDLSRKEVRDYVIDAMRNVFSSAAIEYVKWDMNRVFSDVFSTPSNAQTEDGEDVSGRAGINQGEIAHRYILGLYEIMDTLTKEFPHILFEGCASGGNRFDLGILSYFPQIWASDDTDPICRAEIQQGYSYGYPMECMGAHVSASPNHQTLRRTPMKTRFAVAAFGTLGYECNFSDFTKEAMEEVKTEIALYKQYRSLMQHGVFYRGGAGPLADLGSRGDEVSALYNPTGYGNITVWTMASEYGTKAIGMMLKKLVLPNTQSVTYYPKGLEEDTLYHFTNKELSYDIRDFGDLINTVAPIHVKPDSRLLDFLAKRIKLPAEKEDYVAYGSLLVNAGVALKQDFSGTGYNENVRYVQDFSAKMFLMEEADDSIIKAEMAETKMDEVINETAGEASAETVAETTDEEKESVVETTEEMKETEAETTDEEKESEAEVTVAEVTETKEE